MQLDFQTFAERAVSPFLELGAYEALWEEPNASFKTLADRFAKRTDTLPSDFVERPRAICYANEVHARLKDAGIKKATVFASTAQENTLSASEMPTTQWSFCIFKDDGSRQFSQWWPSSELEVLPKKDPKQANFVALLKDDFTIVSGLATGIDTAAHSAAISEGGRTIAVLGTPLSKAYPAANADLQKEISTNHLVVTQVPVKRYSNQPNPTANNYFFPERNVTMSALTDATIIVEAGDTSDTNTSSPRN